VDEYIGIVKIETLRHTLLLQDYTSYFYLRVEDKMVARLKVRISRQGEVLVDDKWMMVEDGNDFYLGPLEAKSNPRAKQVKWIKRNGY
jgi:hypothetical protein